MRTEEKGQEMVAHGGSWREKIKYEKHDDDSTEATRAAEETKQHKRTRGQRREMKGGTSKEAWGKTG